MLGLEALELSSDTSVAPAFTHIAMIIIAPGLCRSGASSEPSTFGFLCFMCLGIVAARTDMCSTCMPGTVTPLELQLETALCYNLDPGN